MGLGRLLFEAAKTWASWLGIAVVGLLVLQVLPSFLEKPPAQWGAVLRQYLESSLSWLTTVRVVLLTMSYGISIIWTIYHPPLIERRISPKVRSAMVHTLAGISNVEVTVWIESEESGDTWRIAHEDVIPNLEDSGWAVDKNQLIAGPGPSRRGLTVGLPVEKQGDSASLTTEARALGVAFKLAGMDVRFEASPFFKGSDVSLMIGVNPRKP